MLNMAFIISLLEKVKQVESVSGLRTMCSS